MYWQKEKNSGQDAKGAEKTNQGMESGQAAGKGSNQGMEFGQAAGKGSQSIGKKIKQFREQGNITQSGLAEELSVTRQAVSNWERDKTLPDVYTLQQIAAYFGMTLDEFMEGTKKAEIVMPKTPSFLAAATGLTIFLYFAVGGVAGRLYVGTAAGMVIIGVFCQLFLHLYFSSAVKTGNFSALAGYNSKVEYNVDEVKKVLIQMDTHISCTSFGTVLLIGVGALFGAGQAEYFMGALLLMYSGELTVALLLYNYRSLDRTLAKEQDRLVAKAGYLSSVWFVVAVFAFIGASLAKVSIHSIQNNSKGSAGFLGWMLLFLLVTMAELFYEQHRVKKNMAETGSYRPGAAFWAGTVAAAGVTALMFFF